MSLTSIDNELELLCKSFSDRNLGICIKKIYGSSLLEESYYTKAHKSQNMISNYPETKEEFLKKLFDISYLHEEQNLSSILEMILNKAFDESMDFKDQLPLFTYTL